MILPEKIDAIFNPILQQIFKKEYFKEEVNQVVEKIADATIKLWRKVKANLLPTPSKFHYIFNLRDVSRIFKGMCTVLPATIKKSGKFGTDELPSEIFMIALWRHEV